MTRSTVITQVSTGLYTLTVHAGPALQIGSDAFAVANALDALHTGGALDLRRAETGERLTLSWAPEGEHDVTLALRGDATEPITFTIWGGEWHAVAAALVSAAAPPVPTPPAAARHTGGRMRTGAPR